MAKQIDQLIQMEKDFEQQVQTAGKEAIAEFFAEAFTVIPEAVAFTWNQYTPHFNDGEPCLFRVNDLVYFTSDEAVEEGQCAEECCYFYGDCSAEKKKVGKDFSRIPDRLMESAFGDGVQVLVRRKDPTSFEIKEYDHD